MDWQDTTTAFVVALCMAYSVWMLLPAAPRARWAARLLGQTLPVGAPGGCGGCGGCGAGGAVRAARATQGSVVRVVRRQHTP